MNGSVFGIDRSAALQQAMAGNTRTGTPASKAFEAYETAERDFRVAERAREKASEALDAAAQRESDAVNALRAAKEAVIAALKETP